MHGRFLNILRLTILLTVTNELSGQIAMPDIVCAGAAKHYYVDPNPAPGSTYIWRIDGIVQTGVNTNEIFITWTVVGDHVIDVQESTAEGCTGPLRSGQVTVNAIPVITGSFNLTLGSTSQLAGSGIPATSSPWISASPSVATVNSTGLITSVSEGTSIITYTDINGCSNSVTVSVNLASYNRPLTIGWNWFSVNTTISNMTIGNVLTNVTSNGDFIKDQVSSATYYTGTGWFGTLTTISPAKLYKLRVQNSGNISFSGTPIDVNTTGIGLVTGWNWISFLPRNSMSLAYALSLFPSTNLDYIKSQTKSSTYYNGTGWFGTLTQLLPGEGYMMKLANPATLRYPGSKKGVMISGESEEADVNAADYEFNGTVTASVYLDSIIAGSENDKLFAYVNGQLRGATSGNYFAPVGTYLFPLMVHSNAEEGEVVGFKYYNAETNKLYPCKETIVFSKDMIVADAFKSFKLNAGTVKAEDIPGEETGGLRLKTYPNPFDQFLNIEYAIAEGSRIRLAVYDPYGKLIKVLVDGEQKADSYLVRWDSSMNSEGMYIIKLQAGLKQVIRKVILVKK